MSSGKPVIWKDYGQTKGEWISGILLASYGIFRALDTNALN